MIILQCGNACQYKRATTIGKSIAQLQLLPTLLSGHKNRPYTGLVTGYGDSLNSDLIKCTKFGRQEAILTPNQFYMDEDTRLIAFLPSGSQILATIPLLNGATVSLSGVAISHNSDGAATAIQNNDTGQTIYYDVIFFYK